jgi:FkbM family methyltransferase
MRRLVPKLLLECERLYNRYTSFPRFQFACSRIIAWGEKHLGFEAPLLYLRSGLTVEYSSLVAGDIVIRDLLLTGSFEPKQTEIIKRLLPNGGTFIDVGANVGYFSIVGATTLGPSGRVYAFEPVADIYKLLCRNISLNKLNNVTPVNSACFSSSGEMAMMRDIDSAKSRLSPVAQENETVQLTTLDAFVDEVGLERIDFIKIDAEGSDLEVLKGASRTVGRFRPAVMVELSGPPLLYGSISDVFRFFEDRPYKLSLINGRWSVDLLCEPLN